MAILTADQLTELRQRFAATLATLGVTKAEVNAALQAVEDYFENTARAGFGAAIETAVPAKFTAAQKKRLVAYWLLQKFTREGVS